jgi:hypothetical protein
MPNGSQPQIPDHAYDDNCDDSESLAPLIRATILFLVPVSPRHYRPFAFSLSIYFIFKGNALAIVALEPFVRQHPDWQNTLRRSRPPTSLFVST